MEDPKPTLQELARLVRELASRVERLERAAGIANALELGNPSPIASQPGKKANLETRIGSNWLNRIGIVAVLVGVSFFLKYAFESNWVGPGFRVCGALAIGIAVMLWSEWFRARGYRVFSYSLKAVSIGVLYLALWAASEMYALIASGAAFVAMIAVTGAMIALSLWQDAEVLAALALIGGVMTPVLLGNIGHELRLFTYLLVLDAASFVLAYARSWVRILILSFAGTEGLYFGWYARHYRPEEFGSTAVFATLFFVVFALVPLLLSARTPQLRYVRRLPVAITVLNAGAYFLAMDRLLATHGKDEVFACAVALGILFMIFAQAFKDENSPTLRYVHTAIGVALITIAIGIRFEGLQVTLGWFAEAAAMMIIGFWRHSAFIRWLALATIAVAVIKVFVIDVWNVDRPLRIASFTLLGLLLLAISFLYQRAWSKGSA